MLSRLLQAASATLIVILLACFGPAAGPSQEGPKDLHIVLIGIDTLRADALAVYGAPYPTSPHIDRLAEEGALFVDAVATSPWTLPSFASVLSGQYPSSHGAGRRTGEQRKGGEPPKSPLISSVRLVPEILRNAGFETALFYDNPYLSKPWGLTRGFNTVRRTREGGGQAVELALRWLEQRRNEATFVFLHLMEPHMPYQPPEPFRTAALDWKEHRDGPPDPEALYLGEVAYTDHLVGAFLDGLDELGLSQDTLVILTSDHGEEFGEHAEIERRLYNDPREKWGVGHGHSQFQELIAVPLIVRFPGRVTAGERVDSIVQIHDLAPSILNWVDVPVPEAMQGLSLLQTLEGHPERSFAYSEFILYGDSRHSYRDGNWKLILGPSMESSELYDLATDPGETVNLRDEQPQLFRRLAKRLRAVRVRARTVGKEQSTGERESVEIDPQMREELRALGYLD